MMRVVDSERVPLLIRPREMRRSGRRMSALRANGRRVSDAGFFEMKGLKGEESV